MNVEAVYEYCLGLPQTTVDTPFGPDVLVFRVAEKIFAMMGIDHNPVRLNLKCDPERAIDLRAEHPSIIPGYHANKKHWNTVLLDGTIAPKLIQELITHSYDLVVAALPKSKKP
jgi:predicted DNA-binding protein (MmcQ/YjbR family)